MTSEVMATITSWVHDGPMERLRPIALPVALLFTAYSVWVVIQKGYTGFLTLAWQEPWAMQMLLDLTISLIAVTSVLVIDARRRGVAAWPWVLGTVLLGSVAPLWYLVLRPSSRA
ncbi:MAG: hypothetical protein KDK70_05985 [Myxococcales bacterium]|nr:hypothetical protein [Myxococcales bacterium]